MTDIRGTNENPNGTSCNENYGDYLNRAAEACAAGDMVLGMHLYLAAYEKAVADPNVPDGMSLSGLREAWNLACDLKERSMAEYVFEKLEPFLTGEEIAQCANKLQSLALDRLEEYGFSREELQDMAQMISEDLAANDASMVKVEGITLPGAGLLASLGVQASPDNQAPGAEAPAESASVPSEASQQPTAEPAATAEEEDEPEEEPVRNGRPEETGVSVAPPDFNPYDEYDTSSVGKSYHNATNDGSGSYVFTRDTERAAQSERARQEARKQQDKAAQPQQPQQDQADQTPQTATPNVPAPAAPTAASQSANKEELPSMPQVPPVGQPVFNYHTLVGYDQAVSVMRNLGIGMQRNDGFRNFIAMMNERHGVSRMPALDTLMFRSPVIEDATRFVDASIGEIGLPVLRMTMEEGFQGASLLCVTTMGDSRPRMNHAHNRFDGPAILVLDDLDMWSMPQPPEGVDGLAGLMMANMSRGARDAMNLIRSAVEDPDIYVLATIASDGVVDPFFCDLLEPITVIDIDYPTQSERADIWDEIMRDHPSLRDLDREALLRFSAGLPRYDLYMAARAALEEAYKTGLMQRMYVPVTSQNIYDKLAAMQPLDSNEYRALEDELAMQLRKELEDLEDLSDESLF